MSYQVQAIPYKSDAYEQAARLRYQLFYREHDIPFDAIFNAQEAKSLHLAITDSSGNKVLAYGQLQQNSSSEFQIYQMVVLPECQGQGLGSQILNALVEAAIERGAKLVVLNARTTKMPFYQKFGFQPVGDVFASLMTGVPHLRMEQRVGRIN